MNLTRVFAIVIRHLYLWPRTIERMMGAFGWPIFDLIIWGLVTTYIMKSSNLSFSLTGFILGGLILWTIVWRVQNDISVNFLDEAWNKNLINIFSTPLTPKEFLSAMIILSLIKISMTTLSITVGAYILYRFNFLATFGLYIPVLFINLLLFGWIYGFLVNGLILRYGYMVAELAWALIALVQPFACVFYPLASLPLWAQKIGLMIPVTYVFEEMRNILFTGNINWNNLLISFILNMIYLVLSLWYFRSMFEKAREFGRLVKLN
ncbi:MAG: ABC transporter permease [Candidatus Gottesmanbacteria bacterium]